MPPEPIDAECVPAAGPPSGGSAPPASVALTLLKGEPQGAGALAEAGQRAEAFAMIQSSMTMAKQCPRNELQAYQTLLATCERSFDFADDASYRYTRGTTEIAGPSAPFLREVARVWTNLWTGFEVINDGPQDRHIRSYAWDLETNNRRSQDATFRKVVYKKLGGKNSKAQPVIPDDRELRELTNRIASIGIRNCTQQLIPPWVISEAQERCDATRAAGIKKDPDKALKDFIKGMGRLHISVEEIEADLGHPVGQMTQQEVAAYRLLWKAIAEGETTWAHYTGAKEKAAADARQDAEQIKERIKAAGAGPPADTKAEESQRDILHSEPDGEEREHGHENGPQTTNAGRMAA